MNPVNKLRHLSEVDQRHFITQELWPQVYDDVSSCSPQKPTGVSEKMPLPWAVALTVCLLTRNKEKARCSLTHGSNGWGHCPPFLGSSGAGLWGWSPLSSRTVRGGEAVIGLELSGSEGKAMEVLYGCQQCSQQWWCFISPNRKYPKNRPGIRTIPHCRADKWGGQIKERQHRELVLLSDSCSSRSACPSLPELASHSLPHRPRSHRPQVGARLARSVQALCLCGQGHTFGSPHGPLGSA